MENDLNNHTIFRNELAALLKKHDCELTSDYNQDLYVEFHDGDTVRLNKYGYGYAGSENIGAVSIESRTREVDVMSKALNQERVKSIEKYVRTHKANFDTDGFLNTLLLFSQHCLKVLDDNSIKL